MFALTLTRVIYKKALNVRLVTFLASLCVYTRGAGRGKSARACDNHPCAEAVIRRASFISRCLVIIYFVVPRVRRCALPRRRERDTWVPAAAAVYVSIKSGAPSSFVTASLEPEVMHVVILHTLPHGEFFILRWLRVCFL